MPVKDWNANRHWLSPGEMPLHHQVQVILATRIATGELKIGDRLPSEGELSELLGVSRSTLRLALAEFEREGLIERTPRRGTYLRRLPPPRTTEFARRRVSMADLTGFVGEGQLVRRGTEVPPSVVSRELDLPLGSTIHYVLRVHAKFMGVRAAIKRYMKNDVIAAAKPRGNNPDIAGEFSHGWIESIPAEPRFAGLLRVDLNIPLLSIWWIENIESSPSICCHLIFRGDQIAFGF